ncbi:hypothetical protein N7491_007905 [Penicillium cf. griseofulvum]|uniref:Uncharacterized protein n=1 Tax=Penicillium cf. griseofulvum TaxID=2972120 RepID=A0A9W9J5C6_9EURO|nr:hypothetical protein N7472_009068 [Penicillium cf. griseofulvum]KAJ5427463.1 hypothetical protein N7491_007905 [Penicillium cf. griseofulvum]KAJ5431663.1 hypothetical protein N7445_008161 [Penicillium cf. griseofulvum]
MRIPIAPSEHPNQHLRKLGANPDLAVSSAFVLVSLQRGWKPGSKTWRKNWNACMNMEYDRLIGCRVNRLATWQDLCAKVGIEGSFTSINQCKKALARVHVNIVDLLDCWNSDDTPIRFKNKEALAAYTQATDKFFSRQIAKQDKVLRALLRHLV